MRDTTAEIELTTGSVVQVFTTDAVGEEFLLAPGGPAGMRALGHGPPRRHKGSARREANKNRMCNTEIFARVLPRGFYDEDGHAIAEGCHGRTEVGNRVSRRTLLRSADTEPDVTEWVAGTRNAR